MEEARQLACAEALLDLLLDVPDQWTGIAAWLRSRGFAVQRPFLRMALGRDAAYGDPARIIRACKKWESLGVDCINFILNANEVVPQDQVMASLKLFAKEVMPAFGKKPASVAAAAE